MREERIGDPDLRGVSYRFGEADRLIAGIAATQHGRVSRRQLLERGLGRRTIDRRIASGHLLPDRPGVYAVGYIAESSRARCATALLDAGPGSLVSHLSSAAEWRFRMPAPIVVDITNGRRLSSRDGIRMHHRAVHRAEVRRLDGIPLTSPCQTLSTWRRCSAIGRWSGLRTRPSSCSS